MKKSVQNDSLCGKKKSWKTKPLYQWFPIRTDFCNGTYGNVWRNFLVVNTEERMLLASSGCRPGSCSIPFSVSDSYTAKVHPPVCADSTISYLHYLSIENIGKHTYYVVRVAHFRRAGTRDQGEVPMRVQGNHKCP